ncbi:hypothetical protein DM860_013277 [Cuscuta australis]|uniref:F-box associated beta-propeller type 3 domain-containing protein n=1 Tax=Cuscuta australis TaxID=267555 RepID=A0A328DNQ9_9ASTE|nr:hypothetical protein DM860_013277 [Cuscuta australis]
MTGSDCKINGSKIVPCRGRKTRRHIGSFIPADLVLNILLLLPADVIYGIMQYVCREWYNIVRSPTFVSSHLQKSTGGAFLLQTAISHPRKFSNLVYAAASGVYKVVVCTSWGCPTVLTVGDKEWRPLQRSCLLNSIVGNLSINRPLSLGGFLYWVSECAAFVISFNAEAETFQEIPFPQGCTSGSPVTLIEMGCFPCLMRWKETWIWELWVLRDNENARWEKTTSDVNLRGQSSLIKVYTDRDRCFFLPLGWLKCGELMAFLAPSGQSRVIVYSEVKQFDRILTGLRTSNEDAAIRTFQMT